MRIFKILILVFILPVSFYAQELAENPKTVYNRNSSKLIGINNLWSCTRNGKAGFTGKISRLQTDNQYSLLIFDIGNQTFQLEYTNLDNASRSHLSDLVKRRKFVKIDACAGGSNGVYDVINIRLITKNSVKSL